MKMGLGIKSHQWSVDKLKFARQLGCESIVAWVPLPEGDGVWHRKDMENLKKQVNKYDMELTAIENFHPAHWDHIVLDEEGKEEQMENICRTIRNAGEVGIECFGYSFSACGVQGYFSEEGNTDGRGNSSIKKFKTSYINNSPPANQEFWFNTIIERRSPKGFLPPVNKQEMWSRFHWFLSNALPVAEKAGVKLCAHPDDPPLPYLRGIYRPLHNVEGLRKLVNLFDSPSNCLEFCQGTISTMNNVNVYQVIEEFASKQKIGYIHFRNTSGTLPEYSEVFIDDGYVDMTKAMGLFMKHGYNGTIIPDHTPIVSSQEPWDAGMAFALGFIRGLIKSKKH
ncbi:mannonate dehydratase [Arenibacter algicola]|uniref:mannonate dehydratase n=1 Tax=Arenibacter algicola TaxID=616991 RepID=UPI001C07D285|nr:mannonate dehydratase [Arenibacter algicola]MBU2904069.1 mannonate dehydratase [Arenibacter algicola]